MERIIEVAQEFCNGRYDYKIEDSLWPNVFQYLSQNIDAFEINKKEIHTLWTVNGGHLRRKVNNDELILSVLLKVLPKYTGRGLTLYRGECSFLYNQNKIGFCWTPEENVAIKFASGLNAIESGGVLLKAYASSNAIISSPNEHSSKQMEEHEYTCNPTLLENISILATYKKRA